MCSYHYWIFLNSQSCSDDCSRFCLLTPAADILPLTDRKWEAEVVLPVTALYASHMYVPEFLYVGSLMGNSAVLMSTTVPLNFQVKLAGGTEAAAHFSVTSSWTSMASGPVTVAGSGPSADRNRETTVYHSDI